MNTFIGLLIGAFVGYKVKGAVIFLRETRNVKYIESVVKVILSNEEVKILNNSKRDVEEDKELQREHIKLKSYSRRAKA